MFKIIVGKRVENLFLENVASNILEFLELTEDQKRKYVRRVGFYETLQHYRLKRGWKHRFERYPKISDMMAKVFIAMEPKLLN